mmetsp:Transcript_27862/g.65822  ORF Transcript_27862/g.65822 Transcript_27862/m.65822 type:complete len:285 (-) Transcript_27862:807-1661(-)
METAPARGSGRPGAPFTCTAHAEPEITRKCTPLAGQTMNLRTRSSASACMVPMVGGGGLSTEGSRRKRFKMHAKATRIIVSASGRPGQPRRPPLKGMKAAVEPMAARKPLRCGSNTSGSSNCFGSLWMAVTQSSTKVPSGTYVLSTCVPRSACRLTSVAGAKSRRPSSTQALPSGSFSSAAPISSAHRAASPVLGASVRSAAALSAAATSAHPADATSVRSCCCSSGRRESSRSVCASAEAGASAPAITVLTMTAATSSSVKPIDSMMAASARGGIGVSSASSL